jgi:hypothetical protein
MAALPSPLGPVAIASTLAVVSLLSTVTPCGAVGPAHVGSQRFGGTAADAAYSIAVDAAGNHLVAGRFGGTVDFGGGTLVSAGSSDAFLAKYDAAGNHLWSRRFGSTGLDYARDVAVDVAGDVLVAGWFNGTVDFGGGPLASAGSDDVFVARFDSAGNHLWSRRYGSSASDKGDAVAVDGAGNAFVTGYFQGTSSFGGAPLTSAGGWDVFLVKVDAAGAHLWSLGLGGSGSSDEGRDLAVDGAGHVVLAGHFENAVDFGGGGLSSAGLLDVFVAKYDGAGAHQWSRRFGDTSADFGESITVDGAGAVVVTGSFQGTADLGGASLSSAGGQDIFVAKYDSGGTHLWSRAFGSTGTDFGYAVATGAGGEVLLAGSFGGLVGGEIDLGGGLIPSAGGADIFVSKYDAAGLHRWSQGLGDVFDDQGSGVVVDAAGHALVTGQFLGSVDFGGGALSSAGGFDLFVARYADPVPTSAHVVSDARDLQISVRPNPSASHATIYYTVPSTGRVWVSVRDVRGRHVARIVEGGRSAGAHAVQWDGRDDRGQSAAAGVYFVTVRSAGYSRTTSIVRTR